MSPVNSVVISNEQCYLSQKAKNVFKKNANAKMRRTSKYSYNEKIKNKVRLTSTYPTIN